MASMGAEVPLWHFRALDSSNAFQYSSLAGRRTAAMRCNPLNSNVPRTFQLLIPVFQFPFIRHIPVMFPVGASGFVGGFFIEREAG
ncbi:MAG: hypothetical protein BWY82_02991 [Verrucomicrobia bacterium ADurb.Bin474]|nr:MAG: hypothetical protein BWY82_02991 [Verrucomicrobia bacterium ADurb.Bin474]